MIVSSKFREIDKIIRQHNKLLKFLKPSEFNMGLDRLLTQLKNVTLDIHKYYKNNNLELVLITDKGSVSRMFKIPKNPDLC